MLNVKDIRTDGGTQSRAAINEQTVEEYAEAMADPATAFPPVVVYFDGRDNWLADGFHRLAAWAKIGREEVPAEVRQGDRRRAILHSVAANSCHGLRRTNADKRRAVMALLEDDEWSKWSNREIARRCAVSDPFVAKVREELSANGLQIDGPRTVERGGTVYEQNTANIGKAKAETQKSQSETEGTSTAGPERQDGGSRGSRPASGRTDAPSGAGETAEEGETAPVGDDPAAGGSPAPDPTPDPYGYGKLTEAALLDTANGLRADLDEEKARRKKAEAERDDFKAKWREATADDMGRSLGNAQRARDTAKGRLGEEQAKNARQGRRIAILEVEVKKLRDKLADQPADL